MPPTLRDHLKRDGWIPLTKFHGNQAIADRLKIIPAHGGSLIPSVEELKILIENDTDLYMGFTQMFKEAGRASLVRDYEQMIELINDVVSNPPIFRDPRGGAPGLSFNNILSAVIVTPSGFNAFINDALNEALQKILSDWCTYLSTKDSADKSLTHDKWLSDESIYNLSQYLQDFDPKNPSTEAFKNAFVKNEDLGDPHWGFKCWNDFFARPFASKDKLDFYRPMPKPDNDNLIISPADSRIYGIATNVSEMDTFWLKGHRYSLKHLLNGDKGGNRHKPYIGGTVYQAYLLPSDYHQWAMPFSGTIEEIVTIPGTYFALSNALVNPTQPDEFASLVEGLPYLSTVSARQIAIIKADNEKIGTGKKLEKGEALGTFQFGGSTVCMVFEPKVNIKWAVSQMEHVLIRSKIATVY